MGSALDSSNATGLAAPNVPVIIPLNRTQGEGSASRHAKKELSPFGKGRNLRRFSFPELPPPDDASPATDAPVAIWPRLGDADTLRACRGLAVSIRRLVASQASTILAVISAGDGDGKTSTAVCLAPELAKCIEGGVLVVDAHFERPDLSAQVVVKSGQTKNASPVVYPTNLPGLSVLPCRHESSSQGNDFTQFDSAAWLDDLRQRWPLVLLDMPSLEHAEAAAILAACDGAYLVVRSGYTARCAVVDAARLVRNSGCRLLGSVLIDM